jgi:hypothetical protein
LLWWLSAVERLEEVLEYHGIVDELADDEGGLTVSHFVQQEVAMAIDHHDAAAAAQRECARSPSRDSAARTPLPFSSALPFAAADAAASLLRSSWPDGTNQHQQHKHPQQQHEHQQKRQQQQTTET